jgi:hypothetical protein
MGVYRAPAVFSIECDECGYGFDTMGEARSVTEQVQQLAESGWKGSHKWRYGLCLRYLPKLWRRNDA